MSDPTIENPAPSASNINLSFTERTARLVLVLTVIGALAIVYQKALGFFFKALSYKIYLPFLISYEHVIISCMLSSGLLILLSLVSYCYSEFFALNHLHNHETSSSRVNTADERYDLLFKLLQLYTALTFSFNLLFIIVIGTIAKNYITISLTSFFIFLFIILLIFKRARTNLRSVFQLFGDFFSKKWKQIILWFGVTTTLLFLLIVIMAGSQKAFFIAKFTTDAKAPINFHFENSIPEKIILYFYSVDINDNEVLTKELELTRSQFRRSFIEVMEKQESNGSATFFKNIDAQIYKGSSKAFMSNKSKYEYNYKLDTIEYLKQGKNFVVINFNLGALNNHEYFNIVNEIHMDDKNTITINKEEFRENIKR
ncbi:hypothetical protein [Paenibacillus oryzisoli]|uniref:Uncharacterized protein n=1 Tax=Paenibacillus oryzisoli TaxID=1850517 RepID=A0A197ZX98_9BACL|nr:hypothetical protein [Paenibacillus oryzisoli]OAS13358.1 hypothetical protein A8708_16000 [Paenibacillus oryzisoli]